MFKVGQDVYYLGDDCYSGDENSVICGTIIKSDANYSMVYVTEFFGRGEHLVHNSDIFSTSQEAEEERFNRLAYNKYNGVVRKKVNTAVLSIIVCMVFLTVITLIALSLAK